MKKTSNPPRVGLPSTSSVRGKKKLKKWFADDDCPICRLMREKNGNVSLEELREAFEESKNVHGAIIGNGNDINKIETIH